MVVGGLEDLVVAIVPDRPPVAQKHMHGQIALNLSDQRLEVVPAVAVDDHDLMNAVVVQRDDDVAHERIETRLRNVNRQWERQQVAVDAVRDGRKTDHRLGLLPGQLAAMAGDVCGVVQVLALRQMAVVRLDGRHRQHRDLISPLRQPVQVRFRQVPLVNHRCAPGRGSCTGVSRDSQTGALVPPPLAAPQHAYVKHVIPSGARNLAPSGR